MSRLASHTAERLQDLVDQCNAELEELFAAKRADPTPNSARAQHIQSLQDERGLYLAELNAR